MPKAGKFDINIKNCSLKYWSVNITCVKITKHPFFFDQFNLQDKIVYFILKMLKTVSSMSSLFISCIPASVSAMHSIFLLIGSNTHYIL